MTCLIYDMIMKARGYPAGGLVRTATEPSFMTYMTGHELWPHIMVRLAVRQFNTVQIYLVFTIQYGDNEWDIICQNVPFQHHCTLHPKASACQWITIIVTGDKICFYCQLTSG